MEDTRPHPAPRRYAHDLRPLFVARRRRPDRPRDALPDDRHHHPPAPRGRRPGRRAARRLAETGRLRGAPAGSPRPHRAAPGRIGLDGDGSKPTGTARTDAPWTDDVRTGAVPIGPRRRATAPGRPRPARPRPGPAARRPGRRPLRPPTPAHPDPARHPAAHPDRGHRGRRPHLGPAGGRDAQHRQRRADPLPGAGARTRPHPPAAARRHRRPGRRPPGSPGDHRRRGRRPDRRASATRSAGCPSWSPASR